MIDARSSERKGRERGQAATRTEIDASRRKHDFPTNTRYKNSGVVPLDYYLHNRSMCLREFFFRSLDRLSWKTRKKERESRRRDISISYIKTKKKRKKQQEERAQRSTLGSVNFTFIFFLMEDRWMQ